MPLFEACGWQARQRRGPWAEPGTLFINPGISILHQVCTIGTASPLTSPSCQRRHVQQLRFEMATGGGHGSREEKKLSAMYAGGAATCSASLVPRHPTGGGGGGGVLARRQPYWQLSPCVHPAIIDPSPCNWATPRRMRCLAATHGLREPESAATVAIPRHYLTCPSSFSARPPLPAIHLSPLPAPFPASVPPFLAPPMPSLPGMYL